MSQMRPVVTTEESGLVVIELRIGPETKSRVANGVAGVKSNEPFWLFICNFGRVERRLLNNMVIETASKIPLVIMEVPGSLGPEVAQCLNIVSDAAEADKNEDIPDRQGISGHAEGCTVQHLKLASRRLRNFN